MPRQRTPPLDRRAFLAGAGGTMLTTTLGRATASAPTRQLICQSFTDTFDEFDRTLWQMSDGWELDFTLVRWRRENVRLNDHSVQLVLDDQPVGASRYGSGEVQSQKFAHYGRYEIRMRPARCSGVISSFFTYTGPPFGDLQDEIDIEFVGRDTTKLSLNYFADGGRHTPVIIDLGFDAAEGMNEYAYEWRPADITWFVNGRKVHAVDRTAGPMPSRPGKICFDLWAARNAPDWAGSFTYPGQPVIASYERVSFTPFYANCTQ